MNLLKNSYNNNMFPLNKRNTDEKPLMSDRNASQNMRAYSFNKYSHNDLKVINRKNTDNINLKTAIAPQLQLCHSKFKGTFILYPLFRKYSSLYFVSLHQSQQYSSHQSQQHFEKFSNAKHEKIIK